MSLFVHRRAIARAVSGDLPEPSERRLRTHLQRCDACRAHYDELAQLAEALAAKRADAASAASTSAAAAGRERARLVAALPSETTRAAGAYVRPRRPVWAAALLVPAAAAVWFALRPAPGVTPAGGPDGGGVVWRGGPAEEPGPPAALLIFASRREGGRGAAAPDTVGAKPAAKNAGPPLHVRLVADLPASGEGRVSRQDFVQFVLRGLQAPAFVTVIGIDDTGELHTYVPPAGGEPQRRAPSSSAISLGTSIDLGPGHRPGRLRLYALLPSAPLDAAKIRAAAARVDLSRSGAPPLELPVPQVAGVLTIGP